MGCSRPFSRIEFARSWISSGPNSVRGWKGFGEILEISISRVAEPVLVFTTSWPRFPKMASNPLPSAFLVILGDLLGQLHIAHGSRAQGIVQNDRLAKRRGLAEFDAAGNDGLENLLR